MTAEHYDYPEELINFRGRKIWQIKLKDLRNTELPVFIKPVEEKKLRALSSIPGPMSKRNMG